MHQNVSFSLAQLNISEQPLRRRKRLGTARVLLRLLQPPEADGVEREEALFWRHRSERGTHPQAQVSYLLMNFPNKVVVQMDFIRKYNSLLAGYCYFHCKG